jgi:hypothetical protein
MRGTTSLLRLLLGRGLGSDYPGEFVKVSDEPVHVFEAFALANFLLCSAVSTPDGESFHGGQRGRSTRAMREGCAEHFRATLTLLQPTILIAQGRAVRRWLGTVLDDVEPIPGTLPLERVRFGNGRAVLASFVHPSAPTRDNWGANASQPYSCTPSPRRSPRCELRQVFWRHKGPACGALCWPALARCGRGRCVLQHTGTDTMTITEFITKWRRVELTERSSSQTYFIDLCHLVGDEDPVSADPRGEWFTFERGLVKSTGGDGWADVWKRGFFAWEYKGRHRDLAAANPDIGCVDLPDAINLADPASDAYYRQHAVVVLPGLGTEKGARSIAVPGTRVAWGITVMKNAPNPGAAIKFLQLLLGPTGTAMLNDSGPAAISPALVSGTDLHALPENLRSRVRPTK